MEKGLYKYSRMKIGMRGIPELVSIYMCVLQSQTCLKLELFITFIQVKIARIDVLVV